MIFDPSALHAHVHTNGWLKLGCPWLLWPLISACAAVDVIQQLPHQLSALHLEGADNQGRPTWTLKASRARYDQARRSAVLMEPEGVLYREGSETYQLQAKRGMVLGDGKIIQLQADVQLVQVGEPATVIRGDQLRWNTTAETATLSRNPVAQRDRLRLSAREMVLSINSDDLAFREQVLLEQQPSPRGEGQQHAEPLRVEATEAHWNLRSGAVTAVGPIRGEQGVAGEPPSRLLTSAALTGNSRDGWLDFLGPVTFAIPADEIRLTGREVRWWADRQVLHSTRTLQGHFGAVEVSGEEVVVDVRHHQATVGENCRLLQPDAALQADRCQWQWQEKTVMAEGNVVVQSEQMGHVTRAEKLSGEVGETGLLQFSSVNRQVSTDLVLDRPLLDPSPSAATRREQPLPIQFRDVVPNPGSNPDHQG